MQKIPFKPGIRPPYDRIGSLSQSPAEKGHKPFCMVLPEREK
jgi:hypothetical protein